MSSLQVALAIAGGLALAAVVGHSTWSNRKNRPKQADPLPASQQPTEPGFAEPGFDRPDTEKEIDDAPLTPVQNLLPTQDALIDALAPIELQGQVSGDAALAALPPTRRIGTKQFTVEGVNADTGEWEPLRLGQRYSAFQAGIQLANRMGALNEIEFSEFVMKTQAFADAVGGDVEFPDMLQEVARARELDQFASEHDAQLSFTLRARQLAWSPGYVQQNALRLGFVPGAIPGRMVIPAAEVGLAPMLSLLFDSQAALAEDPNQTPIRSLTLTLDVPQIERSQQPFLRMCQVANELAAAMEGLITDDNGHALSDAALQTIDRDLTVIYDTLEQRDLAAGSLQARRLFS